MKMRMSPICAVVEMNLGLVVPLPEPNPVALAAAAESRVRAGTAMTTDRVVMAAWEEITEASPGQVGPDETDEGSLTSETVQETPADTTGDAEHDCG